MIKNIVLVVIIMVIGTSVVPAMVEDAAEDTPIFNTCESTITLSRCNKGSLSGYVNDTLMNPISGALVRVNFHETYEEDYTDSSGYYHITNIPICYCLKNTTASKVGYNTEWVLLTIGENTRYDFVLTHSHENKGRLPIPDGANMYTGSLTEDYEKSSAPGFSQGGCPRKRTVGVATGIGENGL